MDFIKLKNKRKEYNERVINEIKTILECSDLRFNQLMFLINGTEDYFNEEPWKTLERIEDFKNNI